MKEIRKLIKQETEKAILVEVEVDTAVKSIDREVWLPKSQIEITKTAIQLPDWLLAKKDAAIVDEIRAQRGDQMASAIYGIIANDIGPSPAEATEAEAAAKAAEARKQIAAAGRLSKGNRVIHAAFGPGLVLARNKKIGGVQIQFDDGQIKAFDLAFAAHLIKKVV